MPGMLAAWRSLAGLLIAQNSALTANRFLLIAIPWLVLTSTGSPAQTGLVAFCQVLPFVVVQLLTGPLLDRTDPARVSAAGDLISATAILLLTVSDNPPLWLIMTIAAVIGTADGPATAAKALLLPPATAAARQPIERGTGLITAAERSATAAGPALAGLIISTLGIRSALWSAALLFAVAALAASVARTARRPARTATDAGGYRTRLYHGATFLRGDMSLRAIVAMIAVTNLLDQALLTVLLPVWARNNGHGAALVGLLVSCFATTAIGAALMAAWVGHRLPRRPTYLYGFVISGVSRIVALAAGLPPDTVVAVFAVAGLGSGLVNPIITAFTYERIPADLLGRVQTLINAWAWAGIPFGGLAGAALLSTGGLAASLWFCSAAYLTAVLRPGWRVRWNQPSDRRSLPE